MGGKKAFQGNCEPFISAGKRGSFYFLAASILASFDPKNLVESFGNGKAKM